MPLSPIEKTYMAILSTKPPIETDPTQPLDLGLDQFSPPNWAITSPLSHDLHRTTLGRLTPSINMSPR